MTKDEFAVARAEWLLLLEKQPNLFSDAAKNEAGGKHLAMAYWAFMEQFAELKKAKVTG